MADIPADPRAEFIVGALTALRNASPAATIVVAVVEPTGESVMQTRCEHDPRRLAGLAASLAEEAAERIDQGEDAARGVAYATLQVACEDAAALLREALGDE